MPLERAEREREREREIKREREEERERERGPNRPSKDVITRMGLCGPDT
jgi:hypothetical protein